LNASRIIPIDVGERLTGKVGKFSVGALNIETGDESVSRTPATNFSVVRLKRDLLRRSSVGLMMTNGSQSTVVAGASNLAYGADAAFSFFQNVNVSGYYARSDTNTLKKDNASYQTRFDYTGDRYGAQAHYLKVGDNFNPEVGFVRRDNFSRVFSTLRFSPRPKQRFKGVRQFTYQGTVEYIENGAGQLESRNQTGHFEIERQNSDAFTIDAGTNYELLLRPFAVAKGVTIAPGGYNFNDVTTSYRMGQQRRFSGTVFPTRRILQRDDQRLELHRCACCALEAVVG